MNSNSMNMAMNAMAAQAGGGMPMMNNGLPGGQRQQQQSQQVQLSHETAKQQLNTYIYEYFLTNQMFDCARALIKSNEPVNVHPNSATRRRDAGGLDMGGNPDEMEDSKEHFDHTRPSDLPEPNVPKDCPESCFLYEWWCLFWDMFNATRGKIDNSHVKRYQEFTQNQNRAKQSDQTNMIRNISQMGGTGGMMMRGPNGLPMAQNELARKAMQNNGGRMTQQQMAFLQQQKQQQMQMQMQRGGSDMDGRHQGPQSPGSGEGAPSPSKRPRLDSAQFNAPTGINGRGQGGMPGQQHMAGGPGGNGPQNPMMLPNGMNAGNLAAQQFQNYPGQQGGPNAANKAQMQQYTNQLAQHQQAQKAMLNPNGPQGQGSPMMPGQDSHQFYGNDVMVNGGRPGAPAAAQGQPTGSHALQDYQMQLMLLEQQNKKRLLMARQEQDTIQGSGDGPRGPNGQPFPNNSPNGRSVNSPNPGEMMKRGTPQMAPGVIPSPEGQSRGSPTAMNFVPQNMDPNMAPHFYKNMNGMEGGMGPNGMRQAPSSHPAAFNNGPMNQQQMINIQRQQQQQQQGNVGQVPGWNGPNAAPMMQQQGSQQGSQPGPMGTPQQRAMLPPSVPAAAQAVNGRTQPSSPQVTPAPPTPSQTKKANPKAKKEAKPKVRKSSIAEPEGQPLTAKQRKAGQAAATTGATPVGDAPEQPPTPTPQTPISQAQMSFNPKNGQQNTNQNSQPAAPAVSQPPPISQAQPADAQNGFQMEEFAMPMDGMDFVNPMAGGDVLQDFDFDSFLHQDTGEPDQFNFNADFGLEGEVGAE